MKQPIPLVEGLENRQLLAGHPIAFGSAAFDSAYEVAATGDGGVVVAGQFKGAIDLDPTSRQFVLTAVGDTDIYVAKYGAAGQLIWGRRFGGVEGDFNDDRRIDTPTDPERAGPFDLGVGLQPAELGEYVSGLKVDAGGNVYVVGEFRGAVDFDPSASGQRILSSNDGEEFLDIFMMKLNSAGNLVFANQIGGRFTDVAQGLFVRNGESYIAGHYARMADFDPSSATFNLSTNDKSRESAFVARYDANGALVWARQMANEEIRADRRLTGNDLTVDSAGNVYIVGSFSGETDFDPSGALQLVEAVDETDAFLLKLNDTGNFVFAKTWGGEEYDGALHIAAAPNGTLYVASYFEDIVDADPDANITRNVFATPEEIGDEPDRSDVLISSFTAAGTLNWAKSFGADAFETIGGIAADINGGGVFVTGGFYGSADFDPGRGRAVLTSTLGVEDFKDGNDDDRDNSYDAYVWKLDANGRYVFATRFGAASDDYGTAIDVDPSTGNIFVAGQFRGTVRPTSSTKLRPTGKEDSFVSLYSALGELLA